MNMTRKELRHTGEWRFLRPLPVRPQPRPLTFWQVLGCIALCYLAVIAIVSGGMAALGALGVHHG